MCCEVFEKGSVSVSEPAEMSSSSSVVGDEYIKVVNCKFSMSCLWPISRLKEKLVKLRTLVYAVRSLHHTLAQCQSFSTGVPRNLRFPPMASKGSVELI